MAVEISKWRFWVFSYNRGEFLKNCVSSLERCLPENIAITIFDDKSDDSFTIEVLSELASRHEVVYPDETESSEGKHGGLYQNMQSAYEKSVNDDVICFIQDDMQLVRQLERSDMLFIQDHFEQHHQSGFCQATFMKGYNRHNNDTPVRYCDEREVYFVDRVHRSAGTYYSDTFIASIPNLKRADWSFVKKEKHNEAQAKAKLEQMAYIKNPFIAWLPLVPVYRGKRRTVAIRLGEKQRRCGFYPLKMMTNAEVNELKNRDAASKLPYAEDYLDFCTESDFQVPQPWVYDPLQGNRWLKLLNRVELALM